MVTLNVPDNQNEWLRDIDTKEVYESAGLPTESGAELQDFSDIPEWDSHFLDLWDKVVATDNTDRALVGFSESQTPEFVMDRIREAILADTLFSDFDTIQTEDRRQLREFMLETLTSDGWTIDGLADQIEQLGLSSEQAEVIARTETAAVVNTGREEGYKDQGQGSDFFYWSGALDGRQTRACEWLIEQTNPFEGGTPVPLDELKNLIERAPEEDPDMQDNLARPNDFVVHPNERKTFVRAPDSLIQERFPELA